MTVYYKYKVIKLNFILSIPMYIRFSPAENFLQLFSIFMQKVVDNMQNVVYTLVCQRGNAPNIT